MALLKMLHSEKHNSVHTMLNGPTYQIVGGFTQQELLKQTLRGFACGEAG